MSSLLENPLFLFFILLWVLPWKGLALWKSAKNNQKKWFIVLLLVNTMAILEIIYIFYFAKKNNPNDSNYVKFSNRGN